MSKIEIVYVSDIVEANGKTIRENNLALNHKFKEGQLVIYEGHRYIVSKLTRDCDGTPLYSIREYVTFNSKEEYGISEEELTEYAK